MKLKFIFVVLLVVLIGLYGCTAYIPEKAVGNGVGNENQGNVDNEVGLGGNDDQDGEEEDSSLDEIPPLEESTPLMDKYILAGVGGLNIRTGPSSSYKSLGKMDKDDMLAYMGKEGSWYKTVYKEQTAYVSSLYTTTMQMPKSEKVAVEKVIEIGKALMGHPYVWGSQRYHWGNGNLNTNFQSGKYDCSALMQYIFYKGAGVLLELTTRTQVVQGTGVEKADIERGDLLFFTNSSRRNNSGVERVGHVALYLGGNYILHTASDHAVIEPISPLRWSYYITARRFL